MSVQAQTAPSALRRLSVLLRLFLIAILAVTGVCLLIDRRVSARGRRGIPECGIAGLTDGAQCVIVPGALVYGDSPSPMLQDRLDVAIEVYRSGKADRFLLSGDHGRKDYDEVGAMHAYLSAKGIPEDRIYLDHAGFDTYDTLYRARDVFQVRQAIIVTQEFHLLRANYIAGQLDLRVQGVTSDLRAYPRSTWYRVREVFARVKAWLDCEVLHSAPTFLGSPLPIDGDASNTRG